MTSPAFLQNRIMRVAALAVALAMAGAPALAAGPKAYVGNFKDNSVSVIDTGSLAVTATLPVAAGPDGIVVTPDGATAFVSGSSASSVSVIDTATDAVSSGIEVGKGPQGLAVTPDGRWLLVAVNGDDRVALVDIASRAVVGTIAVAKPHTIAVRADGQRAYVTSQEPGHFALAVIDLAARTVVASVPVDKPPRDMEFDSDGQSLYFTMAGVPAVQVLDPATNRIVAQIPTGVSPHLAHRLAGMREGVVVVQGPGELMLFDPATRAPLRSIAVGNAPRKIAVQRLMKTAATAGGDARVSISNFVFEPAQLTVTAGQRVVWSNDDGAPHGVRFNDGTPGQDLMLPGQTFSHVFAKPGVYDYVCSVHPYMTARITVRAAKG